MLSKFKLPFLKEKEEIKDSDWININKIIDDFKNLVDWKDDFINIDISKLQQVQSKLKVIWWELSKIAFSKNIVDNYHNDKTMIILLNSISRVNRIFSGLILNNSYNQNDIIDKETLFKVLFKDNYKDLKSLWESIKNSVDNLVWFNENTNWRGVVSTPALIQIELDEFKLLISKLVDNLPYYYQLKWDLSLKELIINDLEKFANNFYKLSNKKGELDSLINAINEKNN